MSDLVKFLKTGDMRLIDNTDTRTAITQQLLTTIDTELLMQIARKCPIQSTLTLDQLEPLLHNNPEFARCFYAQVITDNGLVANFIQNIGSTEVSGKLHVDGGTLVRSLCEQPSTITVDRGMSYTVSGVTGNSVNVGAVTNTAHVPAVRQVCASHVGNKEPPNGSPLGIVMRYKWYILVAVILMALMGIWWYTSR